MGEFSIYGGKDISQNVHISRENLKDKLHSDETLDMLQTLFDKSELDVNLGDGIDANEAKTILGLFDADSNNDISSDELMTNDFAREFFAENAGTKYSKDDKYMNPMLALAQDIANEFWTVKDFKLPSTSKDHTIKNKNNIIVGGYVLDTVNGVTTKTRFDKAGGGGRVVDELSESWEEGFKNYKKTWRAPDGKITTLTATNVVDNGDGTFNVTVKRTGIGALDKLVTLVLNSDGEEIDRFDEAGNKYDSTGAITKKTFATKDDSGSITGGYDLNIKNGVITKSYYHSDGSENKNIKESWQDGFKSYTKEWTDPETGAGTKLEAVADPVDNGDGTFNVTVKRTDSRYPGKIFTIVMNSNGDEIDRYDEDGNHYDSAGNPVGVVQKDEE